MVWTRHKLEPQCVHKESVKEQQQKTETTKTLRKRRIYDAWWLMHWHQLRSRSHVPQVFQVTSHIVGFRSVLRVVNWILVAVTIYSILTCTQIPCRVHTAKTGLLRCCLYTHRRLQQTAVSCKRSICNKIENNKINSWKPFVWGFTQRSVDNGLPRSITSLCMHPLSLTFFEFLGRPPGFIPLPPGGGWARCRFPFLVLPVGRGPELLSSRFSV